MSPNGTADLANGTAPPTGEPAVDLVSAALPFVVFGLAAGVFVLARVVQSRRR
ncbi:MAG TPA: hypothetical protein VM889_08635 [Candidatus Thermoplasmatota archaeon]|nr:hypothetical protein [Candidatus Thermoplasmatota archaeon]